MNEEIEVSKKRPGGLTALGVLSMVSIGFSFIGTLIGLLSGKVSEEEMLEQSVQMAEAKSEMRKLGMESWTRIYDQLEAMSIQANESIYLAGFLGIVVSATGLAGVLMMWKGRKIGFHIYIIYCLIALGSAYLYISPANIPTIVTIVSVVFSGLFILLYARNLRWMK
ncbi:MAG: hypothetical protein ACI865_001210 [Flavobacteriaceae bacterium]|jgi:hypothetical protein